MKSVKILAAVACVGTLASCSSINRYEHANALSGMGAQELSPVEVQTGEGRPMLQLGGRLPAGVGAWPGLVSSDSSVAEVIYLDGNQRTELGHTATLVGKRPGTTTVYYVPDRREWSGAAADASDSRLSDLQRFELTVR